MSNYVDPRFRGWTIGDIWSTPVAAEMDETERTICAELRNRRHVAEALEKAFEVLHARLALGQLEKLSETTGLMALEGERASGAMNGLTKSFVRAGIKTNRIVLHTTIGPRTT